MTLTPTHHETTAETGLPHDAHAEQAALGCILAAPNSERAQELLGHVLDIAPPHTWYRPGHATILTALRDLADQGHPLDAAALNAHLVQTGQSAATGGAPYLHTLYAEAPAPAAAGYYARIVADRHVQRCLIDTGTRIAHMGRHGGDVDELVEHARDATAALSAAGAADEDVATLAEGMTGFLELLECGAEQQDVVPLPYADLAVKFRDGGFAPGQLVTLGARPGHGKSTLALDVMRHAAKAGKRVLLHTLEMTRRDVEVKMASAETGIPVADLTPGRSGARLSEEQWARLRDYSTLVHARMDVTIDQRPDCSLARVKARVNAMEREGRLPHLVVVDYVQLMETEDAERRDLRIAALTRGLKILAKDKGIVVLLLAQVRRESADRENGLPRPSDFAESSALEKDADVCLMVATPHVDDLEHERAGETLVFVAKNRGGPLGEVGLACQFQYSRCANLAAPVG